LKIDRNFELKKNNNKKVKDIGKIYLLIDKKAKAFPAYI
jgi:hypothetical protein